MRRFDGRLLISAIVGAVFAAFLSLSIALYINARENSRQRAAICQAAQANRQVLSDLVNLIGPGRFRDRAERIVNRPVPCDPRGDLP